VKTRRSVCQKPTPGGRTQAVATSRVYSSLPAVTGLSTNAKRHLHQGIDSLPMSELGRVSIDAVVGSAQLACFRPQ
jgi:hypothetical protein